MQKITNSSRIVRSDNFITATVDDDIVMMSIEKGAYFSLDDIGTLIWEEIAEPKQVSDLCNRLLTQFDVEHSKCETDVLAFLNELASEGMVQVVH